MDEAKFAHGVSNALCIAYVMFGINKAGYVTSRYDAERSTDGSAYNPALVNPL